MKRELKFKVGDTVKLVGDKAASLRGSYDSITNFGAVMGKTYTVSRTEMESCKGPSPCDHQEYYIERGSVRVWCCEPDIELVEPV